ncbi:MAG TPA: TVP38/TMEM64 family protein [Candidatus Coproplasma stercorigallinarum]|nr:TVP38/TMEM64 family protein [Candidatus Coproplasma stercorigallinarum]
MKGSVRSTIMHILNASAVVFGCAAACALFVFGLLYDSIDFINEHRTLLVSLVMGLMFIVMLCSLIFYIFEFKSLYRLAICLIVCLLILSGIFFAVCATGFIKDMTSIEALREYIESSGNWAVWVFILFQFLQVVILPIPSTVTVMAGVALFGPLKCSIFSFIGIFIGSVLAFGIGRWLGYKVVSWIVGKEDLDKWLKKIKGKDYLILSIMFLLPLFPDDVLCFIAGLSSMTWGYFLVMIFVTRALSITLSAYSFDTIPFTTWWGILCWALIISAVVALFWLVCKYSDKIDWFIKNKLGFKNLKKKKKTTDKKKEDR